MRDDVSLPVPPILKPPTPSPPFSCDRVPFLVVFRRARSGKCTWQTVHFAAFGLPLLCTKASTPTSSPIHPRRHCPAPLGPPNERTHRASGGELCFRTEAFVVSSTLRARARLRTRRDPFGGGCPSCCSRLITFRSPFFPYGVAFQKNHRPPLFAPSSSPLVFWILRNVSPVFVRSALRARCTRGFLFRTRQTLPHRDLLGSPIHQTLVKAQWQRLQTTPPHVR